MSPDRDLATRLQTAVRIANRWRIYAYHNGGICLLQPRFDVGYRNLTRFAECVPELTTVVGSALLRRSIWTVASLRPPSGYWYCVCKQRHKHAHPSLKCIAGMCRELFKFFINVLDLQKCGLNATLFCNQFGHYLAWPIFVFRVMACYRQSTDVREVTFTVHIFVANQRHAIMGISKFPCIMLNINRI